MQNKFLATILFFVLFTASAFSLSVDSKINVGHCNKLLHPVTFPYDGQSPLAI